MASPIATDTLPVISDLELYPKFPNILVQLQHAWKTAADDEQNCPDAWGNVLTKITSTLAALSAFGIYCLADDLSLLYSIANQRWDNAVKNNEKETV